MCPYGEIPLVLPAHIAHTVPMFPFYCFATRTVYAPTMVSMHMLGYSVPTPMPGRVLDTDLSVGEAARMYGQITGINL